MQTTPPIASAGAEGSGTPAVDITENTGAPAGSSGEPDTALVRGAAQAPADAPPEPEISQRRGDGRGRGGRFAPGHKLSGRRPAAPKPEVIAARLAAGDLSDVQAALRREAAALLVKLSRIADPGSPKFAALRQRLTTVLGDLGTAPTTPPRQPSPRRKDAIDPEAGLRAVERAIADAEAARTED